MIKHCISATPFHPVTNVMEGKVTPSIPRLLIFFFIGDIGVKQMNAIFPGEMKAEAAAL